MRKLIVMLVLLGSPLMVLAPASRAQSNGNDGKELAVVEFQDKVELLGVTLQGTYLFVHDAQKKIEGKDCFYVYEYAGDWSGPLTIPATRPVVSFHCDAVTRNKVKGTVVTTGIAKDGGQELREIQFGGSDVGHRVAEAM
jgi:hypothetical protein